MRLQAAGGLLCEELKTVLGLKLCLFAGGKLDLACRGRHEKDHQQEQRKMDQENSGGVTFNSIEHKTAEPESGNFDYRIVRK